MIADFNKVRSIQESINDFRTVINCNPLNINENDRIIVIGNSSNVLDNEYGNLIDTYDIIIRINLAKVKDYEKYIGSKTSMRFMSVKSFNPTAEFKESYHGYDLSESLMYSERLLIRIHEQDPYGPKSFLDRASRSNTQNVSLINPDYYNTIVKNYRINPTIGMLAIIAMLENFPNNELAIYGFGFYENCNKLNAHYFEQIKSVPESGFHNYGLEKNIVLDLINQNKLVYLK